MKEEILQKKIVELVTSKRLLESIENQEYLNEALAKDDDASVLPNFSIDSLLKEKYSSAAKRVLDALSDYEIISGESILNISLDKKERLYPDLVLFNRIKCQIILIENKTDRQTEREAVTELFGYTNEIRNHLPFFPSYDISYILISTEFNVLLDHSVSGQLFASDVNLLCLKPLLDGEQITGLDIHFPAAWSDIGQTDLPENALVGYTICLYEKENIDLETFDYISIVNMAVDLIRNSGSKFNSSGFYIAWENGHSWFPSQCKIGITVYMVNAFAFLPEAFELGFPLNDNSALSKYLKKQVEQYGTTVYPHSIFGIANQAERLLNKYFRVEWDDATTWQADLNNTMLALRRRVVVWDSWGAIGDFVRSFYLHPACPIQMFTPWEIENGRGYQNPYIGLQIINYFAGVKVFQFGTFSHQEIFRFGLQIGSYLYACRNILAMEGESSKSAEALLFWHGLQLTQSIKEVSARITDSDILHPPPAFPLQIEKKRIYPDYQERVDNFVKWFKKYFIDEKANPSLAFIFEHSISACHYFNFYFSGILDAESKVNIEGFFSHIVRTKILEIGTDRRKNADNNKEIIQHINQHYLEGELLSMSTEAMERKLNLISDEVLAKGFQEKFLSLLDIIKPHLIHHLNPVIFSNSIDWKAFKQTADKFFDAGNRKIAIQISRNGIIGLVISTLPMQVNNKDEILVQYFPQNTLQMISRRVKWEELLNGSFKI